MDAGDYVLGELVRYRLAELRREAAEVALAGPPRRPLRITLGLALMRLGRRLAGPAGTNGSRNGATVPIAR